MMLDAPKNDSTNLNIVLSISKAPKVLSSLKELILLVVDIV